VDFKEDTKDFAILFIYLFKGISCDAFILLNKLFVRF